MADPGLRRQEEVPQFLASGARGRANTLGAGDMEGGVWWASQAQRLVHDVPTCRQVVDTILAEAERIIEEVLPATCRPAAAQCGPPDGTRQGRAG